MVSNSVVNEFDCVWNFKTFVLLLRDDEDDDEDFLWL